MPFCSHCGKEISEGINFCSNCGTTMQPGAPMQYQTPGGTPYIENHLVKAILATIFCCLPLGIVAIVQASSVNNKIRIGDFNGAQIASQQADNLANWSIGIGIIVGIISIIMMAVGENY